MRARVLKAGFCIALAGLLISCAAGPQAEDILGGYKTLSSSRSGCDLFKYTVTAFKSSFIRLPGGEIVAADPTSAPLMGRLMDNAAAKCLTERHVAFDYDIGGSIHILPQAGPYPNDLAVKVNEMTNGEVNFGAIAFIIRPWSEASFGLNILWLPYAAVLGEQTDATQHELRHVYTRSLLKDGVRARHLVMMGAEDVEPVLADEIFAYAYGATHALDPKFAAWSKVQALRFILVARNRIEDPRTKFWVSTQSSMCLTRPSSKTQLLATLSCVENALSTQSDTEICDLTPFNC